MPEKFAAAIENERSTEDLAADLRQDLEKLGWSPAALMDRMCSLGDYRTQATILRGINRALDGQVRPSGELVALVSQAVRFQRRLLRTYGKTPWTKLGDGSHTTQLEDFTITLAPQTRGRWRVSLVHKDGYSPPFPRWQNSLEAAKHMAFITLDNGMNWILEYEEEQARVA
ncbi:hypothetical protein VDR70_015805 [Xanthomonas campestris pv. campestris]|uniref:hypothetical protein n=1 Tax=Xanthomonas campestris TaxID=339 RepID=UPI0023688A40|nr:hypothetical protein [Xanthomonas campestris]MDM7676554.1 hypothetical protein [Xanthomonas campestris pv. campestris]MDM7681119.1 hypothetical protein [Xanthomonas campestris pv. campestris]MDM7702105.1 hypothetical protein [Xanthomonas campestris pv. campestris]MDM7722870.1 hypothetical protein [Xanthomonas campestris pv. campestris]MEA0941108.1 hypothetical protein [Xanthomonas campestris pv. campestris]